MQIKQLSESKDGLDMKLKVAIDIIESMKNRNEEEARMREKDMETDRYLLKESRGIAEEEWEKMEIAQREIKTKIQVDEDGYSNLKRKEDFDKEVYRTNSIIYFCVPISVSFVSISNSLISLLRILDFIQGFLYS